MENIEILSKLLNAVIAELPKNAEVKLSPLGIKPCIRASWKTPHDPLRKSKRFQPIIIQLHEDFRTSELAERPFLEIRKKFASFIRNKCSQFIPHTTDSHHQGHTPEVWIFPPEC